MAAFKRLSKFVVSDYFFVKRCKREVQIPLFVNCRLMAGHSKWANIKFKKMHRDIARAKILGRFHKEIVTAVREHGPDPALNAKLEHLITRAKAANMTKEKIESAIKSGVKNTGEVIHGLLIEGHGPGGCAILIDTLTSNNIRTRTEVKTIFTKNGGHIGDEGSVSFMYEHKGIINIKNDLISPDHFEDTTEEISNQCEELAIDVGAENVKFERNSDDVKYIQFICAPNDMIQISNKLTKDIGFTLLSANLEYLPTNHVTLKDNLLDKVDRLLEKIIEHEDVVKTYDNVENYPSGSYKYF